MTQRPNVLFIPVDDLRPQLGCYGVDWIHSPNMDRLANDGVLFERAYCQEAVCGPSRCSVMSGCRPDTLGIHDLKTRVRDVSSDVVTLPLAFKNAGYETVSLGKVYHHNDDDLPGWSQPPRRAQGDWKGRGYLTDEALEAIAQTDAEEKAAGSRKRGLGPAFEAADVSDDDYHDGKEALAAMNELERLSKLDQPFFLGLGFHKPHLPFNAPKRYWDMYDPENVPLADNPFEPENASRYALTNYGELRAYFGMPKEEPVPPELATKLIHGYAACVSYVDAQLGRVLERLKQLKLCDNTIIVLWGDHGWKLGEHASWSKHTNFEIDTRAPLILSTPETLGAGLRSQALVEFVDIYPTLCDLCGVEMPSTCEGISLKPLLEKPDAVLKEAAFSLFPRFGPGIMGYTMRTDTVRYTEWAKRDRAEIVGRELYDHRTDPQENVNVAAHTSRADEVERLSARLAEHRNRARPSI